MQQAPAGTAATAAESAEVAAAENEAVSSWDIPLIEGVGLIAAAVAGAAALRRNRVVGVTRPLRSNKVRAASISSADRRWSGCAATPG
jgi:hypothetical protein